MQLALTTFGLISFIFIGLIGVRTHADEASDYTKEMIKIHNLGQNMQREIMILRTKNRDKNTAIQFTRAQFEKTQKIDKEIQSKLQEVYRRKLEQTFASEEIRYLRVLYSSEVIRKLEKFNESVFKSPEAQALITSELKK